MRFSSSRKGITWSLQEIVVLVFAVILLLAILDFSGQIYGALFAGKDDGSKANYDRLVLTIKEMTDPAKTPQFQPNYRIINYFLGEDKILVAFDTDWSTDVKVFEKHGIFNGYFSKTPSFMYRPFACGTQACICLYTDKWEPADGAKRDSGIIDCVSQPFAGKKVTFTSIKRAENPRSSGLDRSGGTYAIFRGTDWKSKFKEAQTSVQRLYIEIRPSETGYSVYLAPIGNSNEDEFIRSRSSNSQSGSPSIATI